MRYLKILTIIFCSTKALGQGSIYELTLLSANGNEISLSEYRGKKIVIAAISPSRLQQKGAVSYWDSFQKSNPEVALILIPAIDLGSESDTALTVEAIQTANDKITLTRVVSTKKDKGENQNALMRWLTHVNLNTHFDSDVNTDNQIFVISESGILYAVLEDGVSPKVIEEVLKQTDINPQIEVVPVVK